MVTNLHTNEREIWNKKFFGSWQLMLTLTKLILQFHAPQNYTSNVPFTSCGWKPWVKWHNRKLTMHWWCIVVFTSHTISYGEYGFQCNSPCHQICVYTITRCYTVYPKKYAHGFCFAVLCCGSTLTDFPISIRLTSLALWQSNDCPSASKATLMNMDKYFMWIHYEQLHNHNKVKHNKTVCIFLGICWIAPNMGFSCYIPWCQQQPEFHLMQPQKCPLCMYTNQTLITILSADYEVFFCYRCCFLTATRTVGARNVLRHRLPELVYQFPADLIRKAKTHSITAFSNHIKHHILESYSYDCIELNCYVCNNIAS